MKLLQVILSTTPSLVLAFAGGGGFGMSKANNSKVKVNKTRQRKNKKRVALVSEDFTKETEKKEGANSSDEPKLDRFGLPILTAENFFPQLPPDTVLEYVTAGEDNLDNSGPYLDKIKFYMKKYIQLNYDLFDDNGIQKFNDSSNTNNNNKPWKIKLLHKNPPVLEIKNFFTDDECNTLMDLTKEGTKSSSSSNSSNNKDKTNRGSNEENQSSILKINSATFSTLAYSKRTSTTWYCHYSQVPTLLSKVKNLFSNLPLEHIEEAQIVRYRTGEEFSWHYDEIPKEQLSNGGQRIATFLVYLKSLSENGGGATIFRDLKGVNGEGELAMRPRKGSALLFFPATLDGIPDDRTLHKGEVAKEEKMIAQLWIHERRYNPVVPEGNSHDAAKELVKIKDVELGYITDN